MRFRFRIDESDSPGHFGGNGFLQPSSTSPSPINSDLRLLLEPAPPTSELYGFGRVATSRRLLPRYTTSCTSSTDIAPWRDRYRQAAALGFDGLLRHLRRTRAKAVARWIWRRS